MSKAFCQSDYYGYIIKGDLIGAISYVRQFPEQANLYNRFIAVYEQEKYHVYDEDSFLNEILIIYQRYYRDVFYLCIGRENAADKLRTELAVVFGINDETELDDIEQNQVAEAFQSRGFHFLGGMTSGYYGPYVWRVTETKTFEVELPDGIQTYTVKILDGFISKSWLDYLSFGETGTGGWTDGDGIINCVKSSYDFDSENFKVSLLKHEAQHARDLAVCKDMSSEDLEYRAKLVELIYSSGRNLLERFAKEADSGDKSNSHLAASARIVEGFSKLLGKDPAEFENLKTEVIQATAKVLFESSNSQIINHSIDSYAPVQNFSYMLLSQNLGQNNPVLSPVSAYLAVSMAGLGAQGKTYEEFRTVLDSDMMCLQDDLIKRLPQDADNLQVALANSVWLSDRFTVQEHWLDHIHSYYKADVYQRTLATGETKSDINLWVEQNTGGMIPGFLSEPPKADVDMLIFDTVYFQGKWKCPFKAYNTQKREFMLDNGDVVMADTMSMPSVMQQYFQNNLAEGIILPYWGNTYSFVAVKPAEGLTVRDMYERFTMREFMALIDTGIPKRMRLCLPKFEITFDQVLNDNLQNMGLCSAFGSQADFGKIADKSLYISQLRQKAVFRLDEEGTEASAATKVELSRGIVREDQLYPMYFDKPFLYMIIENETRVPLFMGIMDNPV